MVQPAHAKRTPGSLLLLKRIGGLWVAYIKGQFLLSLCMSGLTWVLAAGLGLHRPFFVGMAAGLLQTIPVFGPVVALFATAGVALWKGSAVIPVEPWVFSLIAAGSLLILQQISALFIEPRLLGKRLDIRPIVVLAAVIVGGIVGNVVGAYLAVPVLATIREIVRFSRYCLGSSATYPEQD